MPPFRSLQEPPGAFERLSGTYLVAAVNDRGSVAPGTRMGLRSLSGPVPVICQLLF